MIDEIAGQRFIDQADRSALILIDVISDTGRSAVPRIQIHACGTLPPAQPVKDLEAILVLLKRIAPGFFPCQSLSARPGQILLLYWPDAVQQVHTLTGCSQ